MKSSEILFSAKSMLDDFGRVFYYQDKIYRAINQDKKEYCINLINSDLFKELLEKKYIPQTKIASFSIENHDLVLEHEKLTETLQHEWSFSMLKDAALLVLNINEICNKYNFELKDAHTLNVLFNGVTPVWVDIGSIAPIDPQRKNWNALNEFVGSFVIPLLFWSENNFYVTRKLLESNFYRMDVLPSQHILDNDLLSLLKKSPFEYQLNSDKKKNLVISNENKKAGSITGKINSIIKKVTSGTKPQLLNNDKRILSPEGIKKLINDSDLPKITSAWQDYHQHYYSGDGTLKSSERFEKIIGMIQSIFSEVKSVTDLAGNQGLFCLMIEEKLKPEKIILTDYDSNAIESAYLAFKEKGIKNIVPVLLNFMFTPDMKGTASRLKSDLVLALAVTHHLILSNRFSIETIMERIKSYSNKFVMIEFMPLGLWEYGSTNYPALPEWYHEEWFHLHFEKHFILLKKEKLEENRIVFFGKIKS